MLFGFKKNEWQLVAEHGQDLGESSFLSGIGSSHVDRPAAIGHHGHRTGIHEDPQMLVDFPPMFKQTETNKRGFP